MSPNSPEFFIDNLNNQYCRIFPICYFNTVFLLFLDNLKQNMKQSVDSAPVLIPIFQPLTPFASKCLLLFSQDSIFQTCNTSSQLTDTSVGISVDLGEQSSASHSPHGNPHPHWPRFQRLTFELFLSRFPKPDFHLHHSPVKRISF